MAKAPAPGETKKSEQKKAVRQSLRIKFREWDVRLFSQNIPISEKVAVRAATGLPVEAFIPNGVGTFGEDMIFVIWWLGRRTTEPGLPYELAVSQWPTDLSIDEIELVFDDGEDPGDSPEA